MEQHPFERIGREFFSSLPEELIQQPFELRHICRFVPIRGPSPTEKLDPVPSFNPRDRRPASSGREQAGADGDGRKESIPKVLRIGVEQRRRLGRAERSRQLAGVVVGRILFLDFCRRNRDGDGVSTVNSVQLTRISAVRMAGFPVHLSASLAGLSRDRGSESIWREFVEETFHNPVGRPYPLPGRPAFVRRPVTFRGLWGGGEGRGWRTRQSRCRVRLDSAPVFNNDLAYSRPPPDSRSYRRGDKLEGSLDAYLRLDASDPCNTRRAGAPGPTSRRRSSGTSGRSSRRIASTATAAVRS